VKLREHNVVTTCFPDVTLGRRILDVGITSCVCWERSITMKLANAFRFGLVYGV